MNLNQVTIPSKDVRKATAFYEQIGLKLIVYSADRYARFECPGGESTFSIHLAETVSKQGTWVYFEVDDVVAKVNELAAKGILVNEGAEEKPWLWIEARLKDPDGNQIIIYKAGEKRKNPPWRIKKE